MSTDAISTATNYLTVQDILWINLRLTGESRRFDFAVLEEATFLQYGYGVSSNIPAQAGNFLKGFIGRRPFGKADAATAFVGTVAFLMLNGYELNLPDREGAAWVERIVTRDVDAGKSLENLVLTAGHHEGAPEECIELVFERYPGTIGALSN